MYFWWFLGGYFVLSLIFLPVQYSYIKELKERRKANEAKGIRQDEMVDNMSFEEQQLTYNAQGNLLMLGSNLFAELIYYVKHRKNKDSE